jgi:hypothetical protein
MRGRVEDQLRKKSFAGAKQSGESPLFVQCMAGSIIFPILASRQNTIGFVTEVNDSAPSLF